VGGKIDQVPNESSFLTLLLATLPFRAMQRFLLRGSRLAVVPKDFWRHLFFSRPCTYFCLFFRVPYFASRCSSKKFPQRFHKPRIHGRTESSVLCFAQEIWIIRKSDKEAENAEHKKYQTQNPTCEPSHRLPIGLTRYQRIGPTRSLCL